MTDLTKGTDEVRSSGSELNDGLGLDDDTKIMLNELELFIKKHKITIGRSANSTNDVYLSQHLGNGKFCDFIFDADICAEAMEHKWFNKFDPTSPNATELRGLPDV
jgi:hypothetical protein